MLIEDINKTNIGKEPDKELYSLRMRFSQIYKKLYKPTQEDGIDQMAQMAMGRIPLERREFFSKYKLLTKEIKKRKLKINKGNELDKVIFNKEMVGVDIDNFSEVPVADNFISISSSFLKDPKKREAVTIHVKEIDEKTLVSITESVYQKLEEDIGKKSVVKKYEQNLSEEHIPLFDLILKPKDKLEKIKNDNEIDKDSLSEAETFDIKKPYPKEHSARLQDPGKYDDWRRTKGGKIYFKITIPKSISIIWGHPKGKPSATWVPQALRFPKDKYTAAEAKKFLSDKKIKYIKFEPATKTEGKKKKQDKKQDDLYERKMTVKFLKADKKEYVVGGIVTVCEEVDSQGDVVGKEEIWKGLKSWMLKGGKVKIMHKGKAMDINVIECYQADEEHHKGGTDDEYLIRKGDWYISLYLGATEETRAIFKNMVDGKLNSFSIGGRASSK